MPAEVLLLTSADLQPLATNAGYMDQAIAEVEAATRALHAETVVQASFYGRANASKRPSTRISLATSAEMGTGIRGFAAPSSTSAGGGPTSIPIWQLLLDGVSGGVLALLDYRVLNPLRVGAAGGLAARYLAPDGARTLAVIGSGQQARSQVQAVCRAVPTIARVRVFSPTVAHREHFADEMTAWLKVQTSPVGSVAEAVADAEIIALANSGSGPVLERPLVLPGALIIAVTGGQITADFVDSSRAVFTSWEQDADQQPLLREPYLSRERAGSYSRTASGTELSEVVTVGANPRHTPDEVVVFELTGGNAHDLAIARWAYDWARATGVGSSFAFS